MGCSSSKEVPKETKQVPAGKPLEPSNVNQTTETTYGYMTKQGTISLNLQTLIPSSSSLPSSPSSSSTSLSSLSLSL